jgi:RNA ligase
MFPIIGHIDDLLPFVQHKPEITVKKQSNGTTVVCYSISTPTTFDDEYARECRGITFDREGKILARPLHKFFNVGEKEETQVANIDWTNISRLMDKRDGSMIMTMVLDGHVVTKTKKSFETVQATRALEYINAHANFHQFCVFCAVTNCTPIFEWTSPEDRIVLKYERDELVLIHIRDNVTGEYVLDLHTRVEHFRIPVVQDVTPFVFQINHFLKKVSEEEQKEGYVVQFTDGNMVKLKTPWYINLHHSVTFTRERDIAKMIIDETIDDFKSYLTSIGESHAKVDAIESKVCNLLLDLKTRVEEFCEVHHHDDRKTFVQLAKSNELFSLIMEKYSNKEIQYNKYFNKYYLKDFNLETV